MPWQECNPMDERLKFVAGAGPEVEGRNFQNDAFDPERTLGTAQWAMPKVVPGQSAATESQAVQARAIR